MNRTLKTTVLGVALFAATNTAFFYGGAFLAQQRDKAEALASGAGFYDSKSGEFRFAVAPIVLDEPSLDNTADSARLRLPALPKHKPAYGGKL